MIAKTHTLTYQACLERARDKAARLGVPAAVILTAGRWGVWVKDHPKPEGALVLCTFHPEGARP